MFPLLPFAAGLLTGAVVTRLVKPEKARTTLDKAQERVREATVSSLTAIEHTSAGLRARLTHTADELPESEGDFGAQPETGEQPPGEGTAPSGEAAQARKPRPRRAATKTAKPQEGAERTDKPDEEPM